MSRTRVLIVGLIVSCCGLIASLATPSWARWNAAPPAPPPGDTVTVYGPHRFTTPNGHPTVGVESFTLAPQEGKLYLLKVTNGNPNGTLRAKPFSVVLNGVTVITDVGLGSAYSATRVVYASPIDTLKVTVDGKQGAFVDVSILEVADRTAPIYGPTTLVFGGFPGTQTVNFAANPATNAPFHLVINNGRPDGSLRIFASVELNGQTILSSLGDAPTVMVPVTLQAQNTLRLSLAAAAVLRIWSPGL